jgi:acetyl/propionyl-CoA carboxylase alpha subunit
MYFQTILKNKKWEIEVHEQKSVWVVSLHQEGGKREVHKIPKVNYRRMDDAISFLFENSSYMIDVVGDGLDYSVFTRGSYRNIRLINDEGLLHESLKGSGALGASNQLASGMPGKIVDVLVSPGQEVKAKQPLVIMEAMKMENEMRASHDAKVKDVLVKKGQSVDTGAVLITFE